MPSNVARPKSGHSQPESQWRRKSRTETSADSMRFKWVLVVLGGFGLTAFLLLLRLLLPLLLLLGFGALGCWTWRVIHRYHQRQRRRQARLNAQFYQLLKRQQGRISALDFAMFARLDGLEAQDYLNEQAQAFSAYGETTMQGEVVYVFNLAAIAQPTQYETAQAAWALAERTRAQRAYLERKQAAWISAQQMSALRMQSSRQVAEKPVIPLPAPPDEYRELSSEERFQIQTGQGRNSATLQYIPPPKDRSARSSVPGEERGQPADAMPVVQNDEDVVTIEVKAVGS